MYACAILMAVVITSPHAVGRNFSSDIPSSAIQGGVSAQQPQRGEETPVVVTTGHATVKRAPDRAWVTIANESRAKTPREAQKLNTDAMNTVMQKLKAAGFSGDAIRTSSYALHPEFDFRDGRQTLRGYVARNSIEVRVDDIARAGEVAEIAVSAGATNVGGIRFDLKDRAAAERDALARAVADARARAEAAAAGAGMKLEKIVRIQEQRAFEEPPQPLMRTMMAEQVAVDAAAPPIAPGELEIRASVTLTASIR